MATDNGLEAVQADADVARRRVLRARAEALAKVQETRADHGEMFVVVFEVGGRKYAVEAVFLQEAIPVRQITPVPCTPDYIVGIVNLRGRILAVTNLKRVFKLQDDPQQTMEMPAVPPPSDEAPAPTPEWEAAPADSGEIDLFSKALLVRGGESLDKIVVLSHEGKDLAILVDRVRGAISIPLDSLDRGAGEGEVTKFIHGITFDGLIVIDATKLLTSTSIVVR